MIDVCTNFAGKLISIRLQAAKEESELKNKNYEGFVKRTAYTCVCLTPEMHGSVTVWEEQEDAWRDAKERAEDLVQENPSVLKCKKVYDGYEVLDKTQTQRLDCTKYLKHRS